MKESKFEQLTKHITQENSLIGFQKFIYNSIENKGQLFEMIKSCRLDDAKCRFNAWRMCLKLIDIDSEFEQKVQTLEQLRKQYEQKRQKAFSILPIKSESTVSKNPLIKNPLMGAISKNEKIQPNEDEFLKDQIRKDVQRTYQDMIFFQNEKIIKLLSNILFVWCKGNAEISYKQGMNEILASIVYVYFQQTAFFSKKPDHFNHVSEQIKIAFYKFNDVNDAEADIYMVFERIMSLQKEMYKTQDSEKKGHFINPSSKNNTPILQRIIDIQDHKLKFMDIQVFRLIKMQDIKTKSFLLRWIRCMHTREFSLVESFNIWDSIFLDYYESPTCVTKGIFQFIDAMCLAMFIYLKSVVLSKQTANQILQTYQKYPVIKKGLYLQQLISLAWSICETLRNPEKTSPIATDGEQHEKINKLHFLQKGGKIHQVKAKQQLKHQETRQQQERNSSPGQRNESVSPQRVQQIRPNSDILPQNKTNKEIILSSQEWQEMETLLKESLENNTNLQSQSLVKKALKILQDKIRLLQEKSETIKHKDPLF